MEGLDRLRSSAAQVFSLFLDPLAGFGPFWSATLLSFFAALLVLTAYRFCSSREAFDRARGRLKSHLLELRLFQDDPVLAARAVLAVLRADLAYLRLHAKPLALLILPISLILLEGQARLDRRPFLAGESVLLHTFWPNSLSARSDGIPQLVVPPGLSVQSHPLRIPELKEIDWRLRAERAGLHRIIVRGSGMEGFVDVSVSDTGATLPGLAAHGPRGRGSSDTFLLWVEYPISHVAFMGLHLPWFWVLLLGTFLFVFALKGIFGVSF